MLKNPYKLQNTKQILAIQLDVYALYVRKKANVVTGAIQIKLIIENIAIFKIIYLMYFLLSIFLFNIVINKYMIIKVVIITLIA